MTTCPLCEGDLSNGECPDCGYLEFVRCEICGLEKQADLAIIADVFIRDQHIVGIVCYECQGKE